jgi:hypothetical protein
VKYNLLALCSRPSVRPQEGDALHTLRHAAAVVCHRRRRIEEIEQHIAISWFKSAVMTGRTRPRPFFFQFSPFLKNSHLYS